MVVTGGNRRPSEKGKGKMVVTLGTEFQGHDGTISRQHEKCGGLGNLANRDVCMDGLETNPTCSHNKDLRADPSGPVFRLKKDGLDYKKVEIVSEPIFNSLTTWKRVKYGKKHGLPVEKDDH
ncbi:hypothetical protein QYF36_010048 [Acer negundo]|nr:hypothetical protein QYF36_010048 [Acer negundo]